MAKFRNTENKIGPIPFSWCSSHCRFFFLLHEAGEKICNHAAWIIHIFMCLFSLLPLLPHCNRSAFILHIWNHTLSRRPEFMSTLALLAVQKLWFWTPFSDLGVEQNCTVLYSWLLWLADENYMAAMAAWVSSKNDKLYRILTLTLTLTLDLANVWEVSPLQF